LGDGDRGPPDRGRQLEQRLVGLRARARLPGGGLAEVARANALP